MKALLIPFGSEGWDLKKTLFNDIIASRQGPPFLYSDVLVLVPSARLKRWYGRMFLDALERVHHSRALVPPEVQTLHGFLAGCYRGLGGPLLIDETGRLVLLEGIVKRVLGQVPSLTERPDLLAPSLSASIADMIERLGESGVTTRKLRSALTDAPFADKPVVDLLLHAFEQYENELRERDLIDPPGMVRFLAERFDPAWLAPYRAIVIDGFHDAGEPETSLLRKIAAQDSCTVVVEGPGLDVVNRAGPSSPLTMVRSFLADLGITSAKEAAPLSASSRYLAEALFSGMSFSEARLKAPSPFDRTIDVLSAITMREEVTVIAGEVKRSLRSGTHPDEVLVAFPSLDEYGPLVEEIFGDHGIPFNRALGRQLSASPVVTAVISLLRAFHDDFSGPSLLRVFTSPFLKFSDTPRLAVALDRLIRRRRITGRKERWLSELPRFGTAEEGGNVLEAPVRDLFAALEPFGDGKAAPLGTWMARLNALLAWSGIESHVARIRGPLNVNHQAFLKLRGTLDSLGAAGRLFPGYLSTFDEWFFLLRKTLMHARFQVPPEDEGGVQVLGLMESIGMPWKQIYLGGLTDGKFPQRLPQNIFLPEATLETLGVRTLEKARMSSAHHFLRLLLSAERVVLTWPEAVQERPTVRSPFIEELSPLFEAGLVNRGRAKTARLQFGLTVADSMSMPGLAKALGRALHGGREAAAGMAPVLEIDLPGMNAVRTAATAEPAPAAVPAPLPRDHFEVTELDAYLACPYDYYVTKVLGLVPFEEVTEDISPQQRGVTVHAILRTFFDDGWFGEQPVTPANRQRARDVLRELADRSFPTNTFRNIREKEIFLNVMVERFLISEEASGRQGLRPAYREFEVTRFPILLSDGRTVHLSGTVDRIDVDDPGNYVIVDYKTGGYPGPKRGTDQEIFQLPVYAVMARGASSGDRPALRTPIGLAYYGLRGDPREGARDVVLYNKEARDDHPLRKPQSSPKTAEEFDSILGHSIDKARQAVEGIRAGRFPAEPLDENRCRFCPNELMCVNRSS
jgi:inactivated superfamily I helicase/RecB family exonuclease